MRGVRPADELAPGLGEELGRGALLLRGLPKPQGQRSRMTDRAVRTLVVVLGDQLDLDAAVFDGFDPAQDAVWMAEVAEESTHVWSSKPRIALFLSAMRHFAQVLREYGADLILHGHDHVHSIVYLDGPHGTKVPMAGVPSALTKRAVSQRRPSANSGKAVVHTPSSPVTASAKN